MQQVAKPKGLAKIWREVKRPFRKILHHVGHIKTNLNASQGVTGMSEIIRKLFEKKHEGGPMEAVQKTWDDFFRMTTKPEELGKLQNRLVMNTDELSHEIVARYIVRRGFCMEYGWNDMWHYFSKPLDLIYPLDSEERKRIASLGKSYKCPYVLPLYNWTEHMATGFGLKQFPMTSLKRLAGRDIIDGGGFFGDSAMVFTEYAPKKVYAFEPNPDTIPVMKKVLAENVTILGDKKDLIKIVPLALGKSKGTLTLFSRGESDGAATTTLKCNYKTKSHEIDVISIDEFVETTGLDVGLIKLDVEGAEYDTILGAKETILKQQPLLIISIYHSLKDFFEIKPLIESWGVGYKFEIRQPSLVSPDTELILMAY